MFKVITFNILSSELAKKEWFPDTDEKYLDKNYRLNKLTDLFVEYIDENYIFCLQEVSGEWGEKLAKFFSNFNYTFCHAPFVKKNGRLGVAICYPNLYP